LRWFPIQEDAKTTTGGGADGHPSPPLPTQLDEEDADEHTLGREIDAPPKIWPKNMMEIIAVIVKSTSKCPEPLLFKFEMNGAAAESNFLVLQKFNFNLEKALAAQARSPMRYGSKFRKGELLLPLLKNHPIWNRMKEMLAHGLQWPTEPITEEDRTADLFEALEFRNHKGATTQPELLLKLVSGDVRIRPPSPPRENQENSRHLHGSFEYPTAMDK
jgi:hypothetical protein